MRKSALQQLVDTARALPGDKAALPTRSVPPPTDAPSEDAPLPDLRVMRRSLANLLQDLARVLEPELTRALIQATKSWDQADTVSVLSPLLEERIANQRAQWTALRGHPGAGIDAAAVEALLTLDTAVSMVTLMEKRLATFVRHRLRSTDPDLLPNLRPFLDVPAALLEAARAWS